MTSNPDYPKKTKGILKHRGSIETPVSAPSGVSETCQQNLPPVDHRVDEANNYAGRAQSPSQRLRAPSDVQRRRTSFSDVAIIAAVPAASSLSVSGADAAGEDEVVENSQQLIVLSEQLTPTDDPHHDADAEEVGLTEEERQHRREFLMKRKQHCHQYQAVAQLLASGGASTEELEEALDDTAETDRRIVVVTEEPVSDTGDAEEELQSV